jgi:26S proteasome regulatory subunit N12
MAQAAPNIAAFSHLLYKLQELLDAPQFDAAKANALVAQLKIQMTGFSLVPPFQDMAVAKAQLQAARSALELASYVSIRSRDSKAFQRNVTQLMPFYHDFGVLLPPSDRQWPIIGLNLMNLLVSNEIAAFHTELELIPIEHHNNPFISLPIMLEQGLTEGSYNKVLSASKQIPSPYFQFSMEVLFTTVRDKIAECAEAAYENIPLQHATRLFKFASDAESVTFAQKHGWKIENNVIVFPRVESKGVDATALRDQHKQFINKHLHYATELERIV